MEYGRVGMVLTSLAVLALEAVRAVALALDELSVAAARAHLDGVEGGL